MGTSCPGLNPCGRVYSPDRDDDPGPGSEHAFRVGFPARGDVLPGLPIHTQYTHKIPPHHAVTYMRHRCVMGDMFDILLYYIVDTSKLAVVDTGSSPGHSPKP